MLVALVFEVVHSFVRFDVEHLPVLRLGLLEPSLVLSALRVGLKL